MINLEVIGNDTSTLAANTAIFDCEFREPLVHQVVTAFLAASRAGTQAQKTRSEVRGGGAKPWRQKGTGRARAGTIRSPIWRSGGVTFAAKPRSYAKKVNKKMYRAAMCSILSELRRQERLVVMDEVLLDAPKTKVLVAKLNELQVGADVLIVADEFNPNLYLASRNIPKITVIDVMDINPVILLKHPKVLFTREAIKKAEERLS